VACLYTMKGLPVAAWKRFGVWLVIGLAIYFLYSFRRSTLRRGGLPEPVVPPPPIEK
jgi:APA family basic amino acid/polyamine antiporter